MDNLKEMARVGGSARKKPYRFGMREVAEVAGKSMGSVQKDRQRGKFNPRELGSLVKYLRWCVGE